MGVMTSLKSVVGWLEVEMVQRVANWTVWASEEQWPLLAVLRIGRCSSRAAELVIAGNLEVRLSGLVVTVVTAGEHSRWQTSMRRARRVIASMSSRVYYYGGVANAWCWKIPAKRGAWSLKTKLDEVHGCQPSF